MRKINRLWRILSSFYKNISSKENERLGTSLLDHISRVAANAKNISKEVKSSKIDVEAVIAAAMCHDLGYIKGSYKDHYKYSAKLCPKFLRQAHFSEKQIQKISKIILAHHRRDFEDMTIEEKIVFVADKCDSFGCDGTIREFMRLGKEVRDRDKAAEMLIESLHTKLEELRQVGIGKKLVEKKWKETRFLLRKVLSSRSRIDRMFGY